jgi:hypothetical protein
MKFNSLRSVVSGAALMLVFSVLLGASAQAQNRDYRDNGYGQYGYQGQWSRDRTRDYAYKLGYHTGYSEVRDANENGYRRTLRDIPGYRNDLNGYLDFMRYRDDYRSAYRRGFEAAFQDFMNGRQRRYNRQDVERVLGGNLKEVYRDDRYDRDDWYAGRDDRNWRNRDRDRDGNWRDRDRDGRYDRNELYRVAQQNGYREGYRQGQDDAYRRRGFNVENDSRYRDALSGYRSEYGNRDDYRRAFREGFRQGYEEGYRNRR